MAAQPLRKSRRLNCSIIDPSLQWSQALALAG
jgi:hypothetical protein